MAWYLGIEQLALYASVASIIILDVVTFDIVKELSWDSDNFGLPYWYGSQSLAWNQDGQKLAVIGYHPTNSNILIWDVNTNKILTRLPNCDSVITSIAWNPRTDALAIGYTTDSLNKLGENMVRIWNTEKYTIVADTLIDGGGPVLLAWDLKDNYLATVSQDNLTQIWKFLD